MYIIIPESRNNRVITYTTGTRSTTDNLKHGLTSDMALNRKASVDSALKTMESAKKHLADDVTDLFGNAFMTIYEF